MNTIKKATIAILALIISVGLVFTSFGTASAAVTEPQNCTQWHTVQSGEYLSMIAAKYGTSWYTIAEINNISNPSLIFPGKKLCIFQSGSTPSSTYTPSSGSTTGSVVALSVKEDKSVTLQGNKLAANTKYDVYLGKYKSDPSLGILVGSVSTDKSGFFKQTFTIPKKLYDILKIRVRLTHKKDAPTTNWFINTTSSGYTGGENSPELSIGVSAVKRNQWVKIETANLPANVTFNVFIYKSGAPINKAVFVGNLRDAKGGKISATFNIPEQLVDRTNLELLVVNNALGMSDEQGFTNKTSR